MTMKSDSTNFTIADNATDGNATFVPMQTEDFSCFPMPFCDDFDCDRSKYESPAACPQCSKAMLSINTMILIALSIFIVIGNTAIIIVIVKNSIFHNPFNIFKCSLAVADELVGVLVVPSGAYELLVIYTTPYDKSAENRTDYFIDRESRIIKPDSVCQRIHRDSYTTGGLVLSMVTVLSVMASIFHLVLLSIDRFLAVRCPIKYNQGRALNNKLALLLILLVWLISILLSVVLPISLGTDHFIQGLSPIMMFTLKTVNSRTGVLYTFLALVLPFLLLVGLNVATGVLLLKKRSKMIHHNSNRNNSSNKSRRSNEVKATITLLVMVAVFTLVTIPSSIALSVYNMELSYLQENVNLHGMIFIVLFLVMSSNSAWNFLIYSWRNENFRKALKNLVFARRNGKRRRLRWKNVKRVVLRNSEKKKRRKKFSKVANTDHEESNRKQTVRKSLPGANVHKTTSDTLPKNLTRVNTKVHQVASISSTISTNSNATCQSIISNSLPSTPCQKSPPAIDGMENKFFQELSPDNLSTIKELEDELSSAYNHSNAKEDKLDQDIEKNKELHETKALDVNSSPTLDNMSSHSLNDVTMTGENFSNENPVFDYSSVKDEENTGTEKLCNSKISNEGGELKTVHTPPSRAQTNQPLHSSSTHSLNNISNNEAKDDKALNGTEKQSESETTSKAKKIKMLDDAIQPLQHSPTNSLKNPSMKEIKNSDADSPSTLTEPLHDSPISYHNSSIEEENLAKANPAYDWSSEKDDCELNEDIDNSRV